MLFQPSSVIFPEKSVNLMSCKQASPKDMSACCRCTKNGRCKNCSCVKAGRHCTGCLPLSLGICQNGNSDHDQMERVTASTTDGAPVNTTQRDQHHDQISHTDLSHKPPSLSCSLPAFWQSNQSSCRWGNHTGESFCTKINSCYKIMVNWKKFLFSVPRGIEVDNFIKEMARLLLLYADKSGLEKIANKAATAFHLSC